MSCRVMGVERSVRGGFQCGGRGRRVILKALSLGF